MKSPRITSVPAFYPDLKNFIYYRMYRNRQGKYLKYQQNKQQFSLMKYMKGRK